MSVLLASGAAVSAQAADFEYKVDEFADLEILRYQVHDFENLTLRQKEYIYYLSQAALCGRDILFDQNYKHNLKIRRTLEAVYGHYAGNRDCDEFRKFEIYLKRVWFSNGVHHHYSMEKFVPECSEAYFRSLVSAVDAQYFPLAEGETKEQLLDELVPVIFNPKIDKCRVNLSSADDVIASSANHYYEGVTQQEVEDFYGEMKKSGGERPVSYGLNSRLEKENGQLVEKTWRIGGEYSEAISQIVFWLEKARAVAENDAQRQVIEKLVSYYRTGDLKTFDEYSIAWVADSLSRVDFVNGFIETYGDPLGLKASWESVVNFKNLEATHRTEIISENAQWFENHSPIDDRFRKKEVRGVSAKVITVAMLGGDCYPATPIGINLPNSNWIRSEHGSKSVTIENITDAYDKAAKENGFLEEFVPNKKEKNLIEKYGYQTDNLHTDLHECLGHGSGQLLPYVDPDALKSYGATIEETRADLFGLYYMADEKMLQLGLLPDKDAYKAQYYKYMLNGLMTQLVRIKLGDGIQEAHMRNRQLIARWVFEHGAAEHVAELTKKDGKTQLVINDYGKLRLLFGKLLAEIQRIKSEGDFEAARHLVETYAVKVDMDLHREILVRYENLHIAPYKGFVNPRYELIKGVSGSLIDICVRYDEDFATQMMRYSKEFSFLR